MCLLQVGIDDELYIVDPLVGLDQEALWASLLSTPITLHSGRQDLEVLRVTRDALPDTVFDTQIAAGLAGMPPQVGYASLVETFCGVKLAKAHTRTNWKRRPLAESVLKYAADDIRYLADLESALVERLEALGRLAWAQEDCAALLDPSLYVTRPADAWQRVKGIGRLPSGIQQRVVALAAWREAAAQQRDLPRQWLLRDDPLIAIASANPADAAELAEVPGIAAKFVRQFGRDIVGALAAPLPPAPISGGPPNDDERRLEKALAGTVRRLARELEVEAEVLAPRREIRRLAAGERDVRALQGWRRGVVAPALASLIG